MNSSPPAPRQIDSWQLAEGNAVAWMQHWGFSDARQTPGGADGGIDVRSSRALGQVKFEAKQVGAPAVQRLVGARGRGNQQLVFFSGAGFAAPAVRYADAMDVALFKYDLLGRCTPQNPAARTLMASSPSQGSSVRQMATRPLTARPTEPTPVKDWFKKHWAIVLGPLAMLSSIVTWADGLDGVSENGEAATSDLVLVFGFGLLVTVGYFVARKMRSG